jgi:recombination protein RecA
MEKSGAWYNYKKDRIGQGKDNSREYLEENPTMANEIENKIREKLGLRATPVQLTAVPSDKAA